LKDHRFKRSMKKMSRYPHHAGPFRRARQTQAKQENKQFDQLEASSLFCPRCKDAVPVRKRLLLVLPEGDRYEYLCARCNTSVGRKIEEHKEKTPLILTP